MLGTILPLPSATVVGNRLRQREVTFKNHCPTRYIVTAEKIEVLPNVGKVVSPFSPSKSPYRANMNNAGQNDKIVLEIQCAPGNKSNLRNVTASTI